MMDGLEKFAERIACWPRLAALAFGLLAALGFPPIHAWPLGLIGTAGLVWLVSRAASRRRAFALGWLFGVAHFTLANNWIATAFTYQAEMPAALGWVAVPLLSLYLAIYPALAALGAHMLARKSGFGLFGVAFAGCWIIAEWLRSWVFTGYAWDPLGLMLLGPWDRPGIAAALPWLGTYALSGLAVLIAVAFGALLARRKALGSGILVALLCAGMYFPAPKEAEGTLAFTLVQPDLRQEELNDAGKFEEQFARIAKLTVNRNVGGKRLVLWPESAVPDYLQDGYPQRYYDQLTARGDPLFARRRIGQVIGPGSLLMTGAVDLEIGEVDGYRKALGARNSVTVLDSEGRFVGDGYDKAHLVPYGEYLALRWLLEPLGASRLVAGSIDFWPGPGPRTLDLGDYGKAGVQICYEIVFSGQVADRANRPDYIFNPSNDGWFGSFGPPQHLAQARLRAIEEGLPVLRATTTGISAVIDARGVVRRHIGMHRADRIDGFVPPAASPTLFSHLGNGLPLGWAFVLIAASAVATRRRAS